MARTVPAVATHVPGDLVTGEIWNLGPKALNDFLSNRPMFRGRGELNQGVLNNTWTAIQFALSAADTDNGHNTVSNNTLYTCQVAGWYWVKGCAAWNPTGVTNVAARIDVAIAKNSVLIVGSAQFLTKGNQVSSAQYASALVQMAVGDFVEVWVRQQTGATQTLDPNGSGTESDMNVIWVHS